MPELPEVEVIAGQLNQLLPGRTVKSCRTLRENVVVGGAAALAPIVGRRFEQVGRRAKLIIFELSGGAYLTSHLRMTGKYVFHQQEHPPHQHDRIVIALENGAFLHYNDSRTLGKLAFHKDKAALEAATAGWGIEPLSGQFRGYPMYEALQSKNTNAKTFFMDGRNIAGLGNIYVAELLFRAGVSPLRPTKKISRPKAAALRRIIPELLNEALASNGTTISDYRRVDEKTGRFQEFLQVYGRAGQDCRQCGGAIQKVVIQQRSSFFCPQCQK